MSLSRLGLLLSLGKAAGPTCAGAPLVRNFRCDAAFRCDRRTNTQAGPAAVTVGLLGELGYVGIDAVLVPMPPRAFSGGVCEPVETPGKLAVVVGCKRNIVLQRVDMQLNKLASNTMRSCPCHLRLRASLTMPLMTGKSNVRPVDGPAVTDRDKH